MAYVLHIFVALLFICFSVQAQEGLQKGLYSSTCPKAEDIVRSTVQKFFNNDSSISPGLLRLHFHDCFVQGCDASVLISGSSSERIAVQNLGLRGFEVVDDAKSQLEAACPGVVSCADILALPARDAVDLTGGPSWSVPLGRRDGRISSAPDATVLPSPTDSLSRGKSAHTIGQTDCLFFRYCLYNFTATGNADQTINGAFLGQLQMLCPQKGNPSKRVALDKDSMAKFDVSYFKNVRDGNAVLESDQRLWGDVVTQNIVHHYAGTIRGLLGLRFDYEFPKSMVKMSSIGVKTGTRGEIRKICSRFN
ncbi:Peroxidase 25 [Ananas comosus]|uniref:Peroxidase n=1 Tax=Ananas comosus TaxID=4615 RepID=A0A199V5H0_ANACO|nr:Peroxidase 25 [Ananas comosus]